MFCDMTIHVSPEKSSWISLGRSTTGVGQWRPATCRLMDEDDSCLLHIYVDVSLVRINVFMIF